MAEMPALAIEETKARALAAHNQTVEVVTELYGPDALTFLRSLSKSDRQAACAELLMAGLSGQQIAKALGVHPATVSQWFSKETTDMQRCMKTALTKDALLAIPESWKRLKTLRFSENEETSRKASLDALRAAGAGVDPGGNGSAITIHAQNAQFNHLSMADLDRKLVEIGEKLGPEAAKLVQAELRGDGKSGTVVEGSARVVEPAPGAGETSPDGGVPGTPGGPPPA